MVPINIKANDESKIFKVSSDVASVFKLLCKILSLF